MYKEMYTDKIPFVADDKQSLSVSLLLIERLGYYPLGFINQELTIPKISVNEIPYSHRQKKN